MLSRKYNVSTYDVFRPNFLGKSVRLLVKGEKSDRCTGFRSFPHDTHAQKLAPSLLPDCQAALIRL